MVRGVDLPVGHAHTMADRTRKRLQERAPDTLIREGPSSGPLFDDLTRAKSANELKEHLETRVFGALLLTQVLMKGVQIWGLR